MPTKEEISQLKKIKSRHNITAWPEHKLNYWAVPKCANTAIKACLANKPTNNEFSREKWVHNPSNLSYITDKEAKRNGFINFSVIRHPYERFISLFKDHGMQRPLKKVYNNSNSHLIGNLDYFIKSVFEIYPTDQSCDAHVRSLSFYLCKNRAPRIKNIIMLTDATEFLAQYNVKLKKINKTDPSIKVELTDQHKEMIYERYKEDFEIFKFKK